MPKLPPPNQALENWVPSGSPPSRWDDVFLTVWVVAFFSIGVVFVGVVLWKNW